MWLQREKGLAVIEKMLGLMFGLCEPSNNDKIFGKNLTYWHWFEASKELKDSLWSDGPQHGVVVRAQGPQ